MQNADIRSINWLIGKLFRSGRGGTGRHTGLKILRPLRRAGSSPAARTILYISRLFLTSLRPAMARPKGRRAVAHWGWSSRFPRLDAPVESKTYVVFCHFLQAFHFTVYSPFYTFVHDTGHNDRLDGNAGDPCLFQFGDCFASLFECSGAVGIRNMLLSFQRMAADC